MKPVVGAFGAWFCTLLSGAAVIILSVLAILFYRGHESLVGGINDPKDGKAVARTIFGAVGVYAVFYLLCGAQVLLHRRQASVALQ